MIHSPPFAGLELIGRILYGIAATWPVAVVKIGSAEQHQSHVVAVNECHPDRRDLTTLCTRFGCPPRFEPQVLSVRVGRLPHISGPKVNVIDLPPVNGASECERIPAGRSPERIVSDAKETLPG